MKDPHWQTMTLIEFMQKAEPLPGIYSFWWARDTHILEIENVRKNIWIKGGKKKEGKVKHEHTWRIEETPVCLYVGKSSNIKKRVNQHVFESFKNEWYSEYKNYKREIVAPVFNDYYLIKRNTTCQLRAGIEHLIRDSSYKYSEIIILLDIKYVEESSPIERFYLENKCIGEYRPWFNVDIER